jgi:hypothetical protein
LGKLDDTKIDHIVSTLEKLDYGSVVITVHDGEITQIETTEKKRFSLSRGNTAQPKKSK